LCLLSRLCDLGQLLLGTSYPGLQVCQGSTGALLLIELPPQAGFSLLQTGYFRLGFLLLVGGGEPYAKGQKPAQNGSPSQPQRHGPLQLGAVIDGHHGPPARGLLDLTQEPHARCPPCASKAILLFRLVVGSGTLCHLRGYLVHCPT
jgi:hypothetical protein